MVCVWERRCNSPLRGKCSERNSSGRCKSTVSCGRNILWQERVHRFVSEDCSEKASAPPSRCEHCNLKGKEPVGIAFLVDWSSPALLEHCFQRQLFHSIATFNFTQTILSNDIKQISSMPEPQILPLDHDIFRTRWAAIRAYAPAHPRTTISLSGLGPGIGEIVPMDYLVQWRIHCLKRAGQAAFDKGWSSAHIEAYADGACIMQFCRFINRRSKTNSLMFSGGEEGLRCPDLQGQNWTLEELLELLGFRDPYSRARQLFDTAYDSRPVTEEIVGYLLSSHIPQNVTPLQQSSNLSRSPSTPESSKTNPYAAGSPPSLGPMRLDPLIFHGLDITPRTPPPPPADLPEEIIYPYCLCQHSTRGSELTFGGF